MCCCMFSIDLGESETETESRKKKTKRVTPLLRDSAEEKKEKVLATEIEDIKNNLHHKKRQGYRYGY